MPVESPEASEDVSANEEPAEEPAFDPLVLEELLIEEVSIDGMCGVY